MDLCRVCLTTVSDDIQTATLFSTTYQTLNLCDMLSACTSLHLDPDDGLPSLICANCLANLITSHEFRVQCQNTDQKLRDILQMASPNKEATAASVVVVSRGGHTVKMETAQYNSADDMPADDADDADELVEELYDDPLDDEIAAAQYGMVAVTEETDAAAEEVVDDSKAAETTEADADAAAAVNSDDVEYKPTNSDADSDDDYVPLKQVQVRGKKPAPLAATRNTPKRKTNSVYARSPTQKNAIMAAKITTGTLKRETEAAALDGGFPKRDRAPPPPEFSCNVCGEVYNKLFRLNAHMNTHAVSKKYYECDKCKARFFSDLALNRHRIKHDQNIAEPLLPREEIFVKFECSLCSRKFAREETLAAHLRDHEEAVNAAAAASIGDGDGEEAVDDATQAAAAAVAAAVAAGAADIGGKFLCEHCPRVFTTKNLLNRHIRSHTGAPQFDCDQCERSFLREEQLVKHMLRHDTLKKHPCTVCDKVFTHVGTLKSHMKTHSDASPFLCCECGKSFGNSGNLKTHMLRHSGVRPYECTQCFSRFPIKGDLHNHMKTHTGVRPATCDICGASFTRQSTLNKHKLIHIGIRPYPCEMCDMR